MSALDPEDEAPAGPEDQQSSDQSKPGLRKAWDAWTSRPENNAALLQFGIAMLQPRSPGQSAIGQFANSIGEAGQASERNVAGQTAEESRLAAQDIKSREAGSREVTAKAYADQVLQGKGKSGGLQSRIATQKAFNAWLNKPEDPIAIQVNGGKSNDPVVQALQRQFPDIKTKGDIIANKAALNAARQLYSGSMAEPDEDTGEPGAPLVGAGPPGATTPPAGAGPTKPVYKDGRQIGIWDPVKGFVPNGT